MNKTKPNATEAISSAMSRLVESLNRLKSTILCKDNTLKGAMILPETGEEIKCNIREHLITAFSDWDIHPTSKTGEVIRYIGYFTADRKIINDIHDLNEAKENLARVAKTLTEGGVSEREMRTAYATNGFPLVHPLQARRLIRIVDSKDLQSISFSVAKGIESIEKITVNDARQRLENSNANDILDMIVNLSPAKQVRWHKPVSPHIRANIVHRSKDGARRSKMIHCSLPIIIEGTHELPKIIFNQPKEPRKKRNDTLSDNKIALPFIKEGYLSFDN